MVRGAFVPLAAFALITRVADVPSVLFTNPQVPARTLGELVAHARANPGRLSYASPSVGTTPHLAVERLKQLTGIELVHIPYRGAPPAMQALLANEVQLYLAGWGASTNEMSSPLRSLVATRVPAEGMGTTNFSGYSNPEMDELLRKALATVDDNERNQLLQEASQVMIEDFGILPLHYEVTPWALRKGLTYAPRVDQYTLDFEITPSS